MKALSPTREPDSASVARPIAKASIAAPALECLSPSSTARITIRSGTNEPSNSQCRAPLWSVKASNAAGMNSAATRTRCSAFARLDKLWQRLDQHQHLFEPPEVDRGRDLDIQEQSGPSALDTAHAADQKSAREDPVQPRRYHRVADLDVLGALDVLHHHPVVDHARDNPASAAALVESINRGVVVVDSQHLSSIGADRDHLADYSLVADNRHPGFEPAGFTAPDYDRARQPGCVTADNVG